MCQMKCYKCKRNLPNKKYSTAKGCIWCDNNYGYKKSKDKTKQIKLKPISFIFDKDLNKIDIHPLNITYYTITDKVIKIFTNNNITIDIKRDKVFYCHWEQDKKILEKYFEK